MGYKMDIFVVWMFVKFPLSLTVQIFILTAFVFLSLVVVAYRKEVGFIAVGFTGLCTFGAIVAWFVKLYNAPKDMAKEKGKRFKRARQGAADEGLILQIIDSIQVFFGTSLRRVHSSPSLRFRVQ
jgi:hypothetical protein